MSAGDDACARDRIEADLAAGLAERERAGLLRRVEPSFGPDLLSNDYLGLVRHPEIARALAEPAARAGSGAGAARLLGGDRPEHRAAEAACAEWLGEEAALLLPSGTQANAALLVALLRPGDAVLSDERNHASVVDAIRLARARRTIFRHRDASDLARALRATRGAPRTIVVTDAVFSMSGATAPLRAIVAAAEEEGAGVVVDEAHAAGVLGRGGAGLVAELGLERRVLARVVTGGKALGVAGAFVVGSRALVETVVNLGRSFVFTTAPPPALAAGLARAIALARDGDALRARLREGAAFLRRALRDAGIAVEEAPAPIVAVPLGTAARALAVAARLREGGLDLRAVRPPTVPEGESGLRIVVHADHGEDLLARVAAAVGRAVRETPVERPVTSSASPRAVFVAGTDTGIGKTVVASLLLAAAGEQGPARYLKPVQTGTGEDDDTAVVAARADGLGASVSVAEPVYRFAEPVAPAQAAAREGVRIEAAPILAAAARAAAGLGAKGLLVVEGAGGLRVPLGEGGPAHEAFAQDEIVRRLRMPVLLVARSGLGTLNHVLLSLEALAARGIPLAGLVLVGPRHADNRRDLERFVPADDVFELPPLAAFDGAALRVAARVAGLGRLLETLPRWTPPATP